LVSLSFLSFTALSNVSLNISSFFRCSRSYCFWSIRPRTKLSLFSFLRVCSLFGQLSSLLPLEYFPGEPYFNLAFVIILCFNPIKIVEICAQMYLFHQVQSRLSCAIASHIFLYHKNIKIFPLLSHLVDHSNPFWGSPASLDLIARPNL
jgi:hypothetical protein